MNDDPRPILSLSDKPPHLQDRGLVDADVVDVGLRVPAARRDGDDALGVRDDAVPGHHVGPVQRQALGLRGLVAVDGPLAAHLRHVQLEPVPLRRGRHDVRAVWGRKTNYLNLAVKSLLENRHRFVSYCIQLCQWNLWATGVYVWEVGFVYEKPMKSRTFISK